MALSWNPTARPALRTIALGATVSAGWVLHDLGVFATCGEPPLALEILPGSALVVLGGALFGWAAAQDWWQAHPIEAAPVGLDPGDLERMRALGYLGDDP